MAIYTAIYSAFWYQGGSWVDITSNILSVSGSNEMTGNRDNALAFGDSSEARLSVQARSILGVLPWEFTPIRINYGINGTVKRSFQGVIVGRNRDLDTIDFSCSGYAALIQATKAYSKLFSRRPVATRTTASGVENPSSSSYRGGLINFILWKAGGRPVEQDFNATYASEAKFWYSCEQAVLAPDWSWVAGESGWTEILKLAQASGGMVFQAADGVVTYRQPFGIAVPASGTPYTFTKSFYSKVTESAETRQVATKIVCTFVPRLLRGFQEVIRDTTSRLILADESATFELAPQWPIFSLDQPSATTLHANSIKARSLAGTVLAPGSSGYHATIAWDAQRFVFTITNPNSFSIVIDEIALTGQPVQPGEAVTVVCGSGDIVRTLDDNPYIQSQEHAERLGQMVVTFYGQSRPIRRVTDCPYSPDRFLGEIVYLDCPGWISNELHVIVAAKDDKTGATADYDLAAVAGLPVSTDFFIVGENYTGKTRKVGY